MSEGGTSQQAFNEVKFKEEMKGTVESWMISIFVHMELSIYMHLKLSGHLFFFDGCQGLVNSLVD